MHISEKKAARVAHEKTICKMVSMILSVKNFEEATRVAAAFHAEPTEVSLEVTRRISAAKVKGILSRKQEAARKIMSQWVETQNTIPLENRRRIALTSSRETPDES